MDYLIALHDIMHYTKKGGSGSYTYFNPPCFIEVLVPSQKSDRPCVCVLGVSILPLSTIFLYDFGALFTAWYFFFVLLHYFININITNMFWLKEENGNFKIIYFY